MKNDNWEENIELNAVVGNHTEEKMSLDHPASSPPYIDKPVDGDLVCEILQILDDLSKHF